MNAPMQAQVKTRTPSRLAPAGTGLLQRKCACGGSGNLASECTECDEKKKTLQRKPSGHQATISAPPIVHDVLGSPGQPLDEGTRAFLEPRLGHDFSRVRVHTDARASESARAVDALAYTVGRDVVFGAGQYAPQTTGGLRLLAHELTHVVQQQHADGSLQKLATVAPADSAAEREADSLSRRVVAGQSVSVSGGMNSSALQREPAGGCGICWGGPQFAGIEAHKVIQMEFEVLYPLSTVEFPFSSPGDANGRLDLITPSPTGFYIGEIKPATPDGFEQGKKDIAFYKKALELTYPGKTVGYIRTLIPPSIFPNPQVPSCPLQTIFVHPPRNGVFGYECDPPYSKLVWRPECECPIKAPKRVPVPVPHSPPVGVPVGGKQPKRVRGKDDGRPVPGPDVLVPVAVMVLAGLLAKQGLKKATGPFGAVASMAALIILLSTTDAEAQVGLEGEDPLMALFDKAEKNGTPVPDALKNAIEKSPALKAKINAALKKGNVAEAQKELSQQMVQVINDNLDQFTSDDLEALATITEVTGDALPDVKVTVETIRQAAENARKREEAGIGATASTTETAKPDSPEKAAGESTEKLPEEKVPAGGAISPAMRERLQKSPSVQKLYKAMAGAAGSGPVVTDEVLQQFLDLVEPYGLTDAEVDALIAKVAPSSGQSPDEILDALKQALDQIRGDQPPTSAQGAGAKEGKISEAGKAASPDAPAPAKEKADEAAPPTPKAAKPESKKAPAKPKGTKKKGEAAKETVSIDKAVENIVNSLAGYTGLGEGEHQMTLLDPPLVLKKTTTAFFAKRLNKVLLGGYLTITPVTKVSDNEWIVIIHAGSLVASEGGKHTRWPSTDLKSEVTMLP